MPHATANPTLLYPRHARNALARPRALTLLGMQARGGGWRRRGRAQRPHAAAVGRGRGRHTGLSSRGAARARGRRGA